MAKLIEINELQAATASPSLPLEIRRCEALEDDNILLFPGIAPEFSNDEIEFFKTVQGRVSYDYRAKQLDAKGLYFSEEKLKSLLMVYADKMIEKLKNNFSLYSAKWVLDKASLFSFEAKDHQAPSKLRYALSGNGDRLLCIFTNIHPTRNLLWATSSEPFFQLAEKFSLHPKIPLPSLKGGENLKDKITRKMKLTIRKWNAMSLKSPYDHFMVKLSKHLLENPSLYNELPFETWKIPSKSSGMFFSDAVIHAPLSQGLILSLTLILPRYAQLNPEKAPVSVLERISREVMMDPSVEYFV